MRRSRCSGTGVAVDDDCRVPSTVAASLSCLSCCQAQKQDSSRMMPTAPAMMPADTCDANISADTTHGVILHLHEALACAGGRA